MDIMKLTVAFRNFANAPKNVHGSTLSPHTHTRRAQGLLHLGIVPPPDSSNGRCVNEDLPSLAAASLSSVVDKLPLVVHSERFLLKTIAWFFSAFSLTETNLNSFITIHKQT
jgi:hypothetical protein